MATSTPPPAPPPVSPFVHGTTNTTDVYYLPTANTRRLVPDAQTLTYMLAGQTVRVLTDAALAALTLGTPMPTRADGTLYQGSGAVVGFQMNGGKKCAVPDATTYRDLSQQTAPKTITVIDLGLIPSGATIPSTSKFLAPPSAAVPLVLLPVRLETRIDKPSGELWLRVYPDDVHVDSFEPNLTADELAARTAYLGLSTTDVPTRQAAFAALARQFGPERAAWITSASAPATTKTSDWTLAPFTNVLPERWIVIGYQGNGPGQVLTIGPPIQDSLAVGPNPNGTTITGDLGMKWITDFPTAIAAGMGFRIPLTLGQLSGFTRLLVVGLRSNLSPADSSARLASLLQAHHYTDGLELLPNNTPTNNTADVSSGTRSTDPDFTQLYTLEQGPALCPSRSTADGDRLARALGIPPQTFAHVSGANGSQDEQAQAMNTVLWPATWGYYLTQIVTGAVPTPEVLLPAARDHFASYVRARGHFPTLRIGSQPYGILPVCWSASWESLEGRALDVPLYGLLNQLRTAWQNASGPVPRVPGALDPEEALVSLLGMTPASTSFVVRAAVGPEYNYAFWDFIQNDPSTNWWTALTQLTRTDDSGLSAKMAETRLGSVTYVPWHRPLSEVIVAPDPLENLAAPAFIAQLAALGWQALRDVALPSAPVPLLFLLLRHAALREYMDTAIGLLIAANAAQVSEGIEAEMVAFTGINLRPSAWELLQRNLPSKGSVAPMPVGTMLDGAKKDATQPAFSAFWTAFNKLATYSASDLDAITREALDLASYRLDSWITSLAQFRLDHTRTTTPSGGIVLGAYGWLDNVGTWPNQPASSGYIHAPSLNQSTTAAVLRSGYLSHQGGPQQPFEIDLSSARVRLALHILDGIREGQSLGALLGYRLERTLQELAPLQPGLFDLIDKLRSISPMDAASQLDVVDGLALIRQVGDPKTYATTGWAATLSVPLQTALTSALTTVSDALDSVADLTLSESVHQLAKGNALRAGATLDSIARGDTPPSEIDFIQTPRTGTALTYRFLAAMTGNSAPAWVATPRSQAEPRLNAWAAAMLGDPSRVHFRAQYVNAAGAVVQSFELGLNRLQIAPIDLLCLPDTQGIAGELADRMKRYVATLRGSTVPATAQLQILPDRNPTWTPQTVGVLEFLGLVQSITRLVGAARPLQPADLLAQGVTPGAVNTAELQARADAAETQLRAALAALQLPTATDAALVQAAAFGVTGAFPVLDSTQWKAQIAVAVAELSARTKALDQLAAGFVRTTASPDDLKDHDTARLKIIFGASFVVLPTLAATDAANWSKLWANSATLQEPDTMASVRWMQRAARVRSNVTLADKAVLFAEALAGHPLLQLQVAQLPVIANDRWVGLDSQTTPSSSTLSLVSFSPIPYVTGSAIGGLMLDEWVEVLPSAQQITGVSFQYSDPIAQAPQAILLAVRPDSFPEWTLESLEGSVLEALDLAQTRAADPDVLFGTVPPLAVDQNVGAFQGLSETVAFVLRLDGTLWLEHGPFGGAQTTRVPVDTSVSSFQALSESEVFVLLNNGTLWHETAPFGTTTPVPVRVQVDSNIALTPPTPPPPPPLPPPPPPPTQVSVPEVVGATVARANTLLGSAGLGAQFNGPTGQAATVTSQSPKAGTRVNQGTTVIMVTANVSSK